MRRIRFWLARKVHRVGCFLEGHYHGPVKFGTPTPQKPQLDYCGICGGWTPRLMTY
jgi:hypothetical protein